jgi:quinol monooxygenase YgiN
MNRELLKAVEAENHKGRVMIMLGFVVVVKFTVDSTRMDEFMPLLKENAKKSLEEPGCKTFEVSRNQNDVFLYELYTTEDDFFYHLGTEHFMMFDKVTSDMVISKHVGKYYLETI